MKLRVISLFAILAATVAVSAESDPVQLRGILHLGNARLFSLATSDGQGGAWASIGDSFFGYEIVAYQEAEKSLTIRKGEEEFFLSMGGRLFGESDLLVDYLDEVWAATLSGNERDLPEARARLASYLEAHPEAVGDLLLLLLQETDERMGALMVSILAEHDASAGRERISKVATDLVKTSDDSEQRRIGLELLAQGFPMDDEVLQAVARISQSDADDRVRTVAIETMGRWLAQNPERQEQLLLGLSGAISSSQNVGVRGVAFELAIQQGTELPAGIVESAAQSLAEDSAPNKLAMVMALGAAGEEAAGFALEHLEAAYRRETNPEMTKSILMQIVRIGQPEAIEMLARLSHEGDELSARNIDDYIEIARSGNAGDTSEIFRRKYALESARIGNP